jgi:hypothetical protein
MDKGSRSLVDITQEVNKVDRKFDAHTGSGSSVPPIKKPQPKTLAIADASSVMAA